MINGSSSTCLPPHCSSPAIHFTMGPKLQLDPAVLEANPGCLGPPPAPAPCPAGAFCRLQADGGAQGGCATDAASYPPTLPGGHLDNVGTRAECEAKCKAEGACQAYSFCAGSNCKGSCDLMPAANYTRQNGYPSVVCMRRGPFDYPEPGDDTAARPYRSLMRTRPLFLL